MSEQPSNGRGAVRFDALRERLAAARGPEYWRSLDELAETPEFAEFLAQEFPSQADQWPQTLDRRRFLQLMGASFALAGLGACTRQPLEEMVPFVRRPEDVVPGRPQYFASAHTFQGYARGVLVESHDGRPTKIEGNPDHPASLGSTDRFAQAAILDLYDPDRARAVTHLDRIRTWDAWIAALEGELTRLDSTQGEGLRILSPSVTSPTWEAQMRRVLQRFPQARWHRWDPAGRDALREATLTALGRPVSLRYDFDAADVVVSLESDFLTTGAGCVRYAHDFMRRRRVGEGQYGMNRLYAFESTPTATGAVADHRVPMEPDILLGFAFGVAREVGVHGTGHLSPFHDGELSLWLKHIGNDLRRTAGRNLVIAGEHAPTELQALALAINAKIGNFGRTIVTTQPVEVDAVSQLLSIRQLSDDMRAGRVETLLVLGGNPVYDAPADVGFAEALDRVPWSTHLTASTNETSERCHWVVPEAHPLETWSDARAFDGTATVMQPLIEPLFGGKSVHEVLAHVAGEGVRKPRDVVRETWRARHTGADFESHWRRIVHDGVVPDTEAAEVITEFQRSAIIALGRRVSQRLTTRYAGRHDELTLLFRPDPNVHDGSLANNGWLQELPKPWTRLTWDNAVLVSPRLAEARALRNGDVVEVETRGATVRAPVWILPGQAEHSITVHLGYGRRRAGRVGAGAGFNAYALRGAATISHAERVMLTKTGKRQRLATTQDHFSMEGRHLVREATLTEYRRDPEFAHHVGHHSGEPVSMYPPIEYEGYAWGMVVNLGACTGCNACVVACNAENNIPVVGKDQVLNGREMHWLRIDRYFHGSLDRPKVAQQPVMCMHCENAPCEVVCPVGATVHSKEGLNEMVYNRCVGTRYCSNNCPYKVRRFNFLQYTDEETELLRLMRNPDVTVRSVGVMEKCTYCVQRINQARIQAKKEDRTLLDGEVITACQQACPTDALVFGDINDPGSEVSRLRRQSLHYSILEELNTNARTTYLARVNNPLPPLERLERNLLESESDPEEKRGH